MTDVKDLKGTVLKTLNDRLDKVNTTLDTLMSLNDTLHDPSVDNTVKMLNVYKAGVDNALKLVAYDFDVALNFD